MNKGKVLSASAPVVTTALESGKKIGGVINTQLSRQLVGGSKTVVKHSKTKTVTTTNQWGITGWDIVGGLIAVGITNWMGLWHWAPHPNYLSPKYDSSGKQIGYNVIMLPSAGPPQSPWKLPWGP